MQQDAGPIMMFELRRKRVDSPSFLERVRHPEEPIVGPLGD
jgi:hypothetical protein